MTLEKMKKVLQMYDEKLISFEAIKNTCGNLGSLSHSRWMCLDMLQWDLLNPHFDTNAIESDDREKAMRWLGFIQGVLFAKGVYTVDEMREHNRD